MCKWGTDKEVIIEQRIIVDACIAHDIVRLNSEGVHTVASCCGHQQQYPQATSDTGAVIRPSAVILPSSVQRAIGLGYEVEQRAVGYPILYLDTGRCGNWSPYGSPCEKSKGHSGQHRSSSGLLWSVSRDDGCHEDDLS